MLTCGIAIWTFLLHIDLCKAAETILLFCRKPQAWVKHQKRIEITRACVLLPEAPAMLWERKYRGQQLLGLPSAVRPGGCCGIPPLCSLVRLWPIKHVAQAGLHLARSTLPLMSFWIHLLGLA